MEQIGLRERKKLKTRQALIDAGLDLFLAQGYDQTTVEQIAAVVEVSPRTFFRYFAGKEDLALHHTADLEQIVTEELRGRPPAEPPVTALLNTYRTLAERVAEAGTEQSERYLKTHRVLDATPALLGAAIGRTAGLEARLAVLIARRRGADGEPDRRDHLIVALVTAALRVGFECPGAARSDIATLASGVEETLAMAEDAFRPGWDGERPLS
ncbi:TetR family transcriptional regulator [Spongiactinospora sp. TRM90649]|uniref:TetR/AcrR family transcriptional regulator n=1 Tax=Spongiactinospora sp. TRM90649 TaxID=3031114 RepID=UPI0023F6C70F|nr:TetR family transcriptional regulator [Spongiactinospora sp. TRM90649]MDF5752587.1 TetR family transcriptional regulator [Spongiactinospora sp. TRM90649]